MFQVKVDPLFSRRHDRGATIRWLWSIARSLQICRELSVRRPTYVGWQNAPVMEPTTSGTGVMELRDRLLDGDVAEGTLALRLEDYAAVPRADTAALEALAPQAQLDELGESIEEARWLQAVAWVRAQGWSEQSIAAALQRGATSHGLWTLHEDTLAPLVGVVTGDRERAVAALAALQRLPWQSLDVAPELPVHSIDRAAQFPAAPRRRRKCCSGWIFATTMVILLAAWSKGVTWILIERYPVFWRSVLKVFGWPMILARVTALAALASTAVALMAMSRGLLTRVRDAADSRKRWCCTWCCCFVPCCWHGRCCLPGCRTGVRWLSNNHREIHVAAAVSLIFIGAVHTATHLLNDVPAIAETSHSNVTLLNSALKCQLCEKDWGCRLMLPRVLMHPACPFEGPISYGQLLGSTPAVTGFLLWTVLLVFWWLSRARARRAAFNRFYYSHNVLMWVWLALLWLHASNQWVGVAFPLVSVVCTAPMVMYLYDRGTRFIACYCRRVEAAAVVYRDPDGTGNVRRGELMRLSLRASESFVKSFTPGKYALLNVKELGGYEWHPFTVCSGRSGDDTDAVQHIDFIIAANGDWSTKLISSFKALHTRQCQVSPRVTSSFASSLSEMHIDADPDDRPDGLGSGVPTFAVDGPFAAPTMSALEHDVIVVVGAGVGVTPFLSLLEALVFDAEAAAASHDGVTEDSVEFGGPRVAHFYWMTRRADDFMLAWPLLLKTLTTRGVAQHVVLHLHVTTPTPHGDAAAFLFREALVHLSEVKLTDDAAGAAGRGAEERTGPESLPLSERDPTLLCKVGGAGSLPVGLPIRFGRPRFGEDIELLGSANPDDNVHVYTCGGAALVESLGEACEGAGAHARAQGREQQKFVLHHERFE